MYGGGNSCNVWYDYLRKGIENIGFTPLLNDECVLFVKDVIFFFYEDNHGDFISLDNNNIDKAIKDLKKMGKLSNT